MRFKQLVQIVRSAHRQHVFEHIWRSNSWGSQESTSGPGSELGRTEDFRDALERLLEQIGPRVLLDAPCGDYNWMRHVHLPDGCRYIGIDIVRPLIQDLEKRWGSATVAFLQGDLANHPLPTADVWLCRESLFHMPLNEVAWIIERWKRSPIPWFLATTSPDVTINRDIRTGGWRHLNLELPPFCMGRPVATLPDAAPTAPAKMIGVWCQPARAELREGARPSAGMKSS